MKHTFFIFFISNIYNIFCFVKVEDKSKSQSKKEESKTKEEPSSIFQRQRVDMLLGELLRKFPLPTLSMPQQQSQQQHQQTIKERAASIPPTNIKVEPVDTQASESVKQEFSDRSIANGNPPSNENSNSGMSGGVPDVKDIKVENASEMKPPPEKRMKQ